MDRLTTGRRHARAGSVTVTELLTRQASPARCTDSSPPGPDDDITETIPVVAPASHRRDPVRGTQLAKLASIAAAGAVLCGAVTVSSLVAHQRREEPAQDASPAVQITGDQALLPDRFDRSHPAGTPAQPPPPRRSPEAAPSRTPATTTTPAPDAGTAGVTSASAGTGVVTEQVSDLELVREFYGRLPGSPAVAVELLSPGLLRDGLGEFLDAWSNVVAIDSLDVVQRPDGVLATVRMRLLGGGHLRVQQLLSVADNPRRIVGAQLLSAQRN